MAQTLTGTVQDSEGMSIPYARVSVIGTSQGTLTNEDGAYRLRLSPGTYQVECSHLGFAAQQATVTITDGSQKVDFSLQAIDLQLATVEIEGGKKDPAYGIMEQVIKAKKTYLRQYDSYRCQTYLRIIRQLDSLDRNDSLPKDTMFTVDLIESQSETNFRRPNQYKSIVQGYRHENSRRTRRAAIAFDGIGSAYNSELTNPYLFYQDVSQASFNFYQNLIEAPDLGDRPFVSPLNSTLWRLTYRYRLVESFIQNGRVHYRIAFEPRNEEGPYFSGELLVVDDLWAIRSIEAEIVPSTLNYFARFELMHRYEADEKGRWLLREERYDYVVEEKKVHHHGQSLAVHRDYEVDIEFPRRFFNQELRRTERDAFEQDSSFWEQQRPIALGAQEQQFIQTQDSLFETYSQAEYLEEIDSIYNHLGILDILFNGISFRDRVRRMRYYVSPVIEQVQWFGVGGYRHALGGAVIKTFHKGTMLGVRGQLDYGFANEDLRGNGRIFYTYAPRKFARLTLKGGNTYRLVTQNTSFTAIFSRSNILNKIFGGAEHRFEVVNGLFLDVGFEFADFRTIDELQLANWTNNLFGDRNRPRSFDPFRQLRFDVKLDYTPRQAYYWEPYRKVIRGSAWPTFSLQYKKAVPGVFGSEINFDFLSLSARHQFSIGTLGTSRWRAEVGRFLQADNIRFTDHVFFRGSDPFIFVNPLQAFQLLDTTMDTRNAYFAGHYLHDFTGMLIDKIPLLNRLPLQTSAGASILAMEDGSFLHGELFAGIQCPIRIRQNRFKIGVFHVSSYSNHNNAIGSQWKIGVTFFDNTKNQWSY